MTKAELIASLKDAADDASVFIVISELPEHERTDVDYGPSSNEIWLIQHYPTRYSKSH